MHAKHVYGRGLLYPAYTGTLPGADNTENHSDGYDKNGGNSDEESQEIQYGEHLTDVFWFIGCACACHMPWYLSVKD